MKSGRSESNGVVMFDRKWGTLKIDAEDEHYMDGYQIKSKVSKSGYVQVSLRSNKNRKDCKVMARVIMNCPDDMFIDHINHDPTDNRKCNLRICTRSENARNGRKQSQRVDARFKGVFYHPAKKYNPASSEAKPWRAYTRIMGKRIWLGYFSTDVEAAMAYNRFAAKEFKEFACFNRFDECPVLTEMRKTNGQMLFQLS